MNAARRIVWSAVLLGSLASDPVRAGEPCTLVEGTEHAVGIRLTAPEGAVVAGVTFVVDHPETLVGIRGDGIDLEQAKVVSKTPSGAVASANDLGDSVRVVIARAGELPLDGAVMRLSFQRCEGAKVPDLPAFSCAVRDASDPSTNPVAGVRCIVVAP